MIKLQISVIVISSGVLYGAGSAGNGEAATANKRGSKRGHHALKQDSDSDRDGSDNYTPGSQPAAAVAAAKAKAKK